MIEALLFMVVAMLGVLIFLLVKMQPRNHTYTFNLPKISVELSSENVSSVRGKLDNAEANGSELTVRDRWLEQVQLLPPDARLQILEDDDQYFQQMGRHRKRTESDIKRIQDMLYPPGSLPGGVKVVG